MKLKSLFLLLLLFASALLLTYFLVMPKASEPVTITADSATERSLYDGKVIGFQTEAGSDAWLGIPYAKPPVGDLRWRAPQLPDTWAVARESLKFGDPCPQFSSELGGIKGPVGEVLGSEDCLYMNIWAPRFEKNEIPPAHNGVPVMLWIHGGGNTIGHGGFYDGSKLAARHNVIVITFNYRLGPFGWFRHPALQTQSTDPQEQSGNYGTLDMLHALKWVNQNISRFGGNPKNVTIFGESAGGRNVFTLLLSPLAEGLFHRAIIQSGSTRSTPVSATDNYADDAEPGNPNGGREILLKLLMADGKATTRETAKVHAEALSDKEVASYLRDTSDQTLFQAYIDGATSGVFSVPQIFRDGIVLPEADSLTLLAQGKYHHVPTMLGTNRDENKLFFALNPDLVSRTFGIFFSIKDPANYDVLAEYHSRYWKLRGVDQPVALMRIHQENVYAYRFDWDEEPDMVLGDFSQLLGAAHGFEIPFIFNHFELGSISNLIFNENNYIGRRILSDSMMSYWAEFAYNGAPGNGRASEQVFWDRWRMDGNKFILLDTPEDGGIQMSANNETLEKLVDDLKKDTRLPSQQARCDLYNNLFKTNQHWNGQTYQALGCQR